MNALLTAEMAVWAPEDLLTAQHAPEQALAALDRKALRMSGTIAAVAVLSVLAAAVLSLFGVG